MTVSQISQFGALCGVDGTTPDPAPFYFDGAPLLRGFSGVRRVPGQPVGSYLIDLDLNGYQPAGNTLAGVFSVAPVPGHATVINIDDSTNIQPDTLAVTIWARFGAVWVKADSKFWGLIYRVDLLLLSSHPSTNQPRNREFTPYANADFCVVIYRTN